MKKYFLVLGLLIGMMSVAYTQPTSGTSTNMGTFANYGASYTIPSSNGVKMAVNIWGMVSKPGQYLIPYSIDMDIVSLLSLAGGPKKGAKLRKVILLRETSGGTQPSVIVVDIQEFMETGDRTILPTIQPNDTIIIDETAWSIMTNNTSILSIISSSVIIYYNLNR